MSVDFKFPSRLGMNKGFIGPDHPGCINSGHSPALFKSKSAAEYLGKPFMVGGDFIIRYRRTETIISAMHGKRTDEMKRHKLRFFKTYAGAKKHFLKLLGEIRSEREKASQAVAKVNAAKPGTPGYMAALLDAADYGMV